MTAIRQVSELHTHLDNIQSSNQLSTDVELRICGPVGVGL